MNIESKVQLVEELFKKLEVEIHQFQKESLLQCVAGCGKCCSTPNIEASPLEFLPWAFHLFIEGQAEKTLDELKQNPNLSCHLYRPLSTVDATNGKCSNYQYRGLICRLFGYGASKDKVGKLRLATCKIIKENQQEYYQKTSKAINNGFYVPIFSDYYMNLSQIDFVLGRTMLPVNLALKRAIEEVLHYYAYRPFPSGFNKIA
ncbi:YkgJ family cysteine cluster protein [Flavobacterium sp. NG2]|uniref:YkgJ family cysteine cluster protein n=1 Tax=Flavobacterium sp. NG2 TaxID=3097547 RepID=UPI002A813EEA|nr:YkgJ family cysteine cluster protein [Flavobacterium sp. NG2]WPR70237.1 YkgJ family cysteine cluster protein [Flavobacterium sp. NG2]